MNIHKILPIDFVIMVVFIIFSVFWVTAPHPSYPFYKYYLFAMFLYTFSKCISGIVLMIKQLADKTKRRKRYILCLLPSVITIGLYIWLFVTVILSVRNQGLSIDNQKVLETFIFIPVSKGFDTWFPAINLNIIFTVLALTGLIMWVLYWACYNRKIDKQDIILISILTPVSVVFLFLEVLLKL